MGRKQKPLVSENFSRGAKLANNSNRYAHTCNHCGQEFPKGRLETLEAHLRRCPLLSQDERSRNLNLMMGSAGTLSQQQQHHIPSIGMSDNHNHQALLALADVSEAQLQSVGSHHHSNFQYVNDTSNSMERYGMEDCKLSSISEFHTVQADCPSIHCNKFTNVHEHRRFHDRGPD